MRKNTYIARKRQTVRLNVHRNALPLALTGWYFVARCFVSAHTFYFVIRCFIYYYFFSRLFEKCFKCQRDTNCNEAKAYALRHKHSAFVHRYQTLSVLYLKYWKHDMSTYFWHDFANFWLKMQTIRSNFELFWKLSIAVRFSWDRIAFKNVANRFNGKYTEFALLWSCIVTRHLFMPMSWCILQEKLRFDIHILIEIRK